MLTVKKFLTYIKGPLILLLIGQVIWSCTSSNEDNVRIIHPIGQLDLKIFTKLDIPKEIHIKDSYRAFVSSKDSNFYQIYLEAPIQNHLIWIQGLIPKRQFSKIDLNTGLALYGKNLESNHIEITYQAYNAKVEILSLPKKVGDPMTLKFNGWFYQKDPKHQLLDVTCAKKRIIECSNLKVQWVENLLEAKKQIES